MKVYTISRNSPSVFYSLTGLSISEFDKLNLSFSRILSDNHIIKGRPHTLIESAHKLFFILFYFKHYCIQELMALIFRVDQSQVSRWISLLQLPFHQCTSKFIDKTRKKVNSLAKLKKVCPNISLIIDATERPILTPKFNQKRVYSGKKHRHTIKNQIIVFKKQVFDTSDTYVGKTHDFKIFKKHKNSIPKHIHILADLGYVGIESYLPDNKTFLPNKASQKFPLTDAEKLQNRLIAKHRVTVEHVLGLMKSNQILAQEFRGSKQLANLSFKAIAGLHNFKMQCRHS